MNENADDCPQPIVNSASNAGEQDWFFNWIQGCTIPFAFALILLIGFVLMIPTLATPKVAIDRRDCKNNLKQIGRALDHYADDWGGLPPAFTVDTAGNRLHSWRTLILPYLDRKALYDTIDLSKPWDDPVNAAARQTVIREFHCPSWKEVETNLTSYFALVGEEYAFHPLRPREQVEFKDEKSQTVIVSELPESYAVEWMSPDDDVSVHFFLSMNDDAKVSHPGGIHVLLADGAVRFLSSNLRSKTRRALLTIQGGEKVDSF